MGGGVKGAGHFSTILRAKSEKGRKLSCLFLLQIDLRVGMLAVHPHLKVQVRAGGKAGRADLADLLPGLDRVALLDPFSCSITRYMPYPLPGVQSSETIATVPSAAATTGSP